MNQRRRFIRFNAVGAAGIGVQLSMLWLLTGVAHVHYLPATFAAVTLAVVHNFWAPAVDVGRSAGRRPSDCVVARFAAANGAVSMAETWRPCRCWYPSPACHRWWRAAWPSSSPGC